MASVKEHLANFHRAAHAFHKTKAEAHSDLSDHHQEKHAHHSARADETDGEVSELHRSMAETHSDKAAHHSRLATAHDGMMANHQNMLNAISATPTVESADLNPADAGRMKIASGQDLSKMQQDNVWGVLPTAPRVMAVPRHSAPQIRPS